MMKGPDSKRIADLRKKLGQAREELYQALAQMTQERISDYEFPAHSDGLRLSTLFEGKRDLIVIHNMGSQCSYCTLWADGYNGIYGHLKSRASFVVSSPDTPERQSAFAKERGWQFPMLSHRGTTFAADMGFADGKGNCKPGISAFQMRGSQIVRVSSSGSEPFDDFCAAWHLFALFPEGADGWRPKLKYA